MSYTYKGFQANVYVYLDKAFKAKSMEIKDQVRKYIQNQCKKDQKFYMRLYIPGRGYYFPSEYISVKMENGIFERDGKDAVTLTKEDDPNLYEKLIQLDNNILFCKKFYRKLSIEYGEEPYDPCIGYLPKVILAPHEAAFYKKHKDIEEKDKQNYEKFFNMLQTNGAVSILLNGGGNV